MDLEEVHRELLQHRPLFDEPEPCAFKMISRPSGTLLNQPSIQLLPAPQPAS